MSEVLHSFLVALSDPKPPSVNHLYTNGYKGRRVLSKEGHAFKAALTGAVLEECNKLPWSKAVDAVYQQKAWVRLTIGLHASIFNGSWSPGGRTAKGDLQCPYKKMDGTNYAKCIEDAVVAGTGIDDAAHLTVTVHKIDDPLHYVELAYEVLEKE